MSLTVYPNLKDKKKTEKECENLVEKFAKGGKTDISIYINSFKTNRGLINSLVTLKNNLVEGSKFVPFNELTLDRSRIVTPLEEEGVFSKGTNPSYYKMAENKLYKELFILGARKILDSKDTDSTKMDKMIKLMFVTAASEARDNKNITLLYSYAIEAMYAINNVYYNTSMTNKLVISTVATVGGLCAVVLPTIGIGQERHDIGLTDPIPYYGENLQNRPVIDNVVNFSRACSSTASKIAQKGDLLTPDTKEKLMENVNYRKEIHFRIKALEKKKNDGSISKDEEEALKVLLEKRDPIDDGSDVVLNQFIEQMNQLIVQREAIEVKPAVVTIKDVDEFAPKATSNFDDKNHRGLTIQDCDTVPLPDLVIKTMQSRTRVAMDYFSPTLFQTNTKCNELKWYTRKDCTEYAVNTSLFLPHTLIRVFLIMSKSSMYDLGLIITAIDTILMMARRSDRRKALYLMYYTLFDDYISAEKLNPMSPENLADMIKTKLGLTISVHKMFPSKFFISPSSCVISSDEGLPKVNTGSSRVLFMSVAALHSPTSNMITTVGDGLSVQDLHMSNMHGDPATRVYGPQDRVPRFHTQSERNEFNKQGGKELMDYAGSTHGTDRKGSRYDYKGRGGRQSYNKYHRDNSKSRYRSESREALDKVAQLEQKLADLESKK